MAKLALLTAKQLARVLNKLGFELIRQRGSHMFFEHSDGRTTLVPDHRGEQIDRGLLNKIIKKDLAMEKEDFMEFFQSS